MKKQKTSFNRTALPKFGLAMTLLLIVACAGQNNNSQRNAYTRALGASNTIGGFNSNSAFNQTYCPQGTSNVGGIFDSNVGQFAAFSTFDSRIKGYLSSEIDPNNVGFVSGILNDTTGVRFQGQVRLDQAGNVVPQESSLVLVVYDSLAVDAIAQGLKEPAPISIKYTRAEAGQFNIQTGQGYITFKDGLGDIRFDGTLDAQNFSGTVTYRNSQSFNGGQVASGQLGQFLVARCAFIK